MRSIKWVIGGALVLAMMGICIDVGLTLMPPMAEAQTKGTIIPWVITWGMILATAAMGIVVGLVMLGVGFGKYGSEA